MWRTKICESIPKSTTPEALQPDNEGCHKKWQTGDSTVMKYTLIMM